MPAAPQRVAATLLALVGAAATLVAKPEPAPLFRDHAVLQRDRPLPIWGRAEPGERITVRFADQTRSTQADTEGRWRVVLDPVPANSTPSTLTLAGDSTLVISDVLVGEVWLASGQSNMEWPLRRTYDHALDIPTPANPLIRHIKIRKTVADSPAETVGILRDTWQPATPETRGEFSAVAYYFARDLQARLDLPIGIIDSTWGGTRAESWLDHDTLSKDPALASVREDWTGQLASYPERKAKYQADRAAWEQRQTEAQAAGQPFKERPPGEPWGPGHHSTPAGLYNGMIAPLIPYALRGVIWYQGESNAWRADRYHGLFSALITGWRARFAQDTLPFYWVQLASYSAGDPDGLQWARLREAQTRTLALPATGQALALDLGDPRDIHPRNKRDVGRRLARLALARTYQIPLVDRGPVFLQATREASSYRVTFGPPEGGLSSLTARITGFELAGADRAFHPAEARFDGSDLILTSPAVPDPVAVRYAWRNAPTASLYNHAGLPAEPFRTDDW
jgi:sialate O-acetylesterase